MDKLTSSWVQYLRSNARQDGAVRGAGPCCPLCETEMHPDIDIDAFKAHVRDNASQHPSLSQDADIENAFRKMSLGGTRTVNPDAVLPPDSVSRRQTRKRPVSGDPDAPSDAEHTSTVPDAGTDAAGSSNRGSKKVCSPPASDVQQRGSSPPTPSRSRARPSDSASEFDRNRGPRRPPGRLWSPGDETQPKTPQFRQSRTAPTSSSHQRRPGPSKLHRSAQSQDQQTQQSASGPTNDSPTMILQPDTRPISQEQLINEVKGIYAGLVMVESKCIEVDTSQSSKTGSESQLNHEQWQALVALHRTLLHEHHDFFLASQHPAASDALRNLADKYAMPARMWRHGIHSFLELLRHRLPASLEHMLTFIYLAYTMVALLYETVSTFKSTWIECLGDLGRYRMAIEDNDIRDREVWTEVSRYWYSKASDMAPKTGRLYHHLAILARPNALQQLYYYAKSLCVPNPFPSASDSIMTLFEPVLTSKLSHRLDAVDAAFIRVHGIFFSGQYQDQFQSSVDEFLDNLDDQINRTAKDWLESGYFIGICLGCSLLGYGVETNRIMQALPTDGDSSTENGWSSEKEIPDSFKETLSFAVQTYNIILRRWKDDYILPCAHTTLVFLEFLSRCPEAMAHIENDYPWQPTVVMLNHLIKTCSFEPRMDSEEFPGPLNNEPRRPLPEDFAMHGLLYAEDYFPGDWFKDCTVADDERYFELPSMRDERLQRILWLGRKIAKPGKWISWDDSVKEFTVAKMFQTGSESSATSLC